MSNDDNLSGAFADDETTVPSQASEPVGFDVESNVPIPTITRRKYPFDKMMPGDSFEVRADPKLVAEYGETKALQRLRSSLSSSATSYAKRHPKFKLVVRKTGKSKLRCWAVQDEAKSA